MGSMQVNTKKPDHSWGEKGSGSHQTRGMGRERMWLSSEQKTPGAGDVGADT